MCVCVCKEKCNRDGRKGEERDGPEEGRKEDECSDVRSADQKPCGHAEHRRRRRCSTKKEERVRMRTRRKPGEQKVKRSPRVK